MISPFLAGRIIITQSLVRHNGGVFGKNQPAVGQKRSSPSGEDLSCLFVVMEHAPGGFLIPQGRGDGQLLDLLGGDGFAALIGEEDAFA